MVTDWSKCSSVEVDPERCSGALTFKGSRSMVSIVFANLGDMTTDELIRQYGFEREQIEDVLQFLAESVEAPSRETPGSVAVVPTPLPPKKPYQQ